MTISEDDGKTWSDVVDIDNAGLPLDAETDIITLKDGTRAYKSEVQWFYIPAGVRLLTQIVSANKGGKVVYVTAHPLANPERIMPIVESLRFD